MTVSDIVLQAAPPQLSSIGKHPKLRGKEKYASELKHWQSRLRLIQSVYFRQGQRAIIVFEGWDASGKGGAIRRIAEVMDPRGFRVYPISAPTRDEQSRHYLYRFQKRLPPAGCIAVFDRSYYGRVLVERVEQLIPEPAWQRAYQEINEFERMLADDGVRILKFFLHITPGEQRERMLRRIEDPRKQWKITDEDLRNIARRSDYETATEQMLRQTSTECVPWHVIAADHKWYTRVAVIKAVVENLERDIDLDSPAKSMEWLVSARKKLGL